LEELIASARSAPDVALKTAGDLAIVEYISGTIGQL
jgi:hypothetical protein